MSNTHKSRRRALFAAALVTIGAGVLASSSASPVQAAVGDNIIVNGDFETLSADGSLVGASTDFALAALGVQGNHYANPGDPLTSWDEGTAVVATNPFDQHVLWANQPSTDHRFIVNGFFDSDNQKVWEQSNPGIVCAVGDQVTYDFSATVANVLPLDQFSNGGAAITVWINGTQVASVDLTTNDPSNPVVLSGNTVPAADPVVLTIRNGSTIKVGNDFSLDNISLIQRTGCLSPVTPAFLSATPATCAARGGFDGIVGDPVFPLDRGDYTLSIDPAFAGAGTYTLTATPDAGFAFPPGTVTTAQITIDPIGFGLDCTTHITAVFDITPTPPTCLADGSLPTFPIVRTGYTLTIDGTGVGTHTITATAAAGYTLDGATTAQVTVLPKLTGPECIPNIGGRTIGFWTNKNGTAAGPAIWNAAKAPYPNAIPASMTFAQAQTALKVDGSTNLGKDMLRAQFIATALNVKYITGYGVQLVMVPATSAVDGGQTVTVTQYLTDVNAAWASLNTKAKITSVKDVLDAINQDSASVLFV
jgi:hypothetical protein